MTYEDVPQNLDELSLFDDRKLAADVVDLFCPDDARRNEALGVLLCDEDGHLLQPMIIDGPPPTDDMEQLVHVIDHLLEIGAQTGSVLLAICHPGTAITDADRRLHQLIIDRARGVDVAIIGAYVAIPGEVLALPSPLAAAG